jgi:Spherulation-specific family 4
MPKRKPLLRSLTSGQTTEVNTTTDQLDLFGTFTVATLPTLAGDDTGVVLWVSDYLGAARLMRWGGSSWSPASVISGGGTARSDISPEMVWNGSGHLKTNENWTSWSIDLVNAPPGAAASFTNSTLNANLFTDEFLFVDPNKTYRGVVNAKATTLGTGCSFFAGVACYDVDGVLIQAYNHMSYSGAAQAVTTRVISAGDTAIYISDGTGWAANSANTFQRMVRLGNFKSTAGYVYPVSDGMYSQLFLCGIVSAGTYNAANPLWNQSVSSITNIGGGEWRIDLAAELPAFSAALTANFGSTIPIGTPVENANSGGTYKYSFASNIAISGTWATAWQRFEATIGGFDLSRANLPSQFAPGTAKIKPLFLPNHSGSVAGTTAVGLSFTPVAVTPARLVNDSNPVVKTASGLINVYGALTDGYSDVRLIAWLNDIRNNRDIQFVFNFNTAAVGGGAGTATAANILAAMRQLKANGAKIAGYVDSGYGSKTFNQVIAGGTQWRNLYGDLIDYIFIDQAGGADTSVNRLLYKSIRQRLEELGFAVMFNAGSPLLTSWYKVSGDDVFGDNAILCISEGNTAPTEADQNGYITSHLFVPKKQLMIILKNQTLATVTTALPTIRKYYGWFSFADDNVYSSRPTWLSDALSRLSARGGNTATAIVDFDTTGDMASSVVAAPWITTSSVLSVDIRGFAPDHPSDDEDVLLEQITTQVTTVVPGVSFTIVAHAPNSTWGRYELRITGV